MDKPLRIHDSHVVLVSMPSIYNNEEVVIFDIKIFAELAQKVHWVLLTSNLIHKNLLAKQNQTF